MSKHTPGPWELLAIVGVGGARQCAFIGQANDEKGIDRLTDEYAVAFVPLTNDESHANARLIAAAPDMLAVLKELIDIEGPQPGTTSWASKVTAIIAQAESAS